MIKANYNTTLPILLTSLIVITFIRFLSYVKINDKAVHTLTNKIGDWIFAIFWLSLILTIVLFILVAIHTSKIVLILLLLLSPIIFFVLFVSSIAHKMINLYGEQGMGMFFKQFLKEKNFIAHVVIVIVIWGISIECVFYKLKLTWLILTGLLFLGLMGQVIVEAIKKSDIYKSDTDEPTNDSKKDDITDKKT